MDLITQLLVTVLACSLVTSQLPQGPYGSYREACWPVRDADEDDVHARITHLLDTHNVTSAWLPIKNFPLQEWRWLDDSYYGQTISSTPDWVKPWMNCAVFRSMDRLLDEVPCSNNYTHYICQSHGSMCVGEELCLNYTLESYHLYKESGTWYQAKKKCEMRGERLASFPKREMDRLLSQIIGAPENPPNIWIGLRNAEFKFDLGNGLSKNVRHYRWAPGAPCQCEGRDCVVIQSNTEGEYQWRNTECSQTHTYLCQRDTKGVPFAVTFMDSTEQSPDENPVLSWIRAHLGLVLGVGVGVILLLVGIIVLIICIICFRRRKKRRAKESGEESKTKKEKKKKKGKSIQDRKLPDTPAAGEVEVLVVDNPKYESGADMEYEDITSGSQRYPDLMHDLPPISVRMQEIQNMEDYYEEFESGQYNLEEIIERNKPSETEIKIFKRMLEGNKQVTEDCFEWVVKELNGELNTRRETRYFLQISLDFHPKNIDEMFAKYGQWDYGIAGIYRWRGRMSATQAWEEIKKIIMTGGDFKLQRWLDNLPR